MKDDKKNNVRRLREAALMSKAELARKAGISSITIDRVESGAECRVDTKRKIILALGKGIEDKALVFPELAEAQSPGVGARRTPHQAVAGETDGEE